MRGVTVCLRHGVKVFEVGRMNGAVGTRVGGLL